MYVYVLRYGYEQAVGYILRYGGKICSLWYQFKLFSVLQPNILKTFCCSGVLMALANPRVGRRGACSRSNYFFYPGILDPPLLRATLLSPPMFYSEM